MLEVRVADRVGPLLDELVALLRVPPADPFVPDWVAVPSIGMRRWLAQRLSERLGTSGRGGDGVAANVDLPFPAELRRRVLAPGAGGGSPHPGAVDPWDVERLAWALLAVLSDDATASHPVLGPVTRVARGATLAGRSLALADLVDRYSLHRPAMVRAWLDGRDVDAAGADLDPTRRWQPELVRTVRAHLGRPGPAERLPEVLDQIRSGALDVELPSRLVLFGASTLAPDLVDLVEALGARREVHALLLAPSVPLALSFTATGRPTPGAPATVRADHPTAEQVAHPLLRSWGTPSRETAAVLALAGVPVGVAAGGAPAAVQPAASSEPGRQPTLFDDPSPDGSPTLLGRLQADLRADRAPDGTHRLDPADRSVQVHACTGVTRQVEVLRDAVLHLLAEHPDLTEGDVAVLCPRMDLFSPVVQAVLGPPADASDAAAAAAGPPALRYRITDRTVRSDVPLLGAVAALLDLVPGRFTASAVADVIGLGPVRDRFGLDVEDLGRLDDWIERTWVRWGLDGGHRSPWGLPSGFGANSWEAGLDQLLLGSVVRPSATTLGPGGVAPLPLGDGSTVLAARIADAVRSLGRARDLLVGARPVADWAAAVRDCVDHLCSLPPTEAWQRRRLDRVLDDLVAASTGPDGSPAQVSLELSDLRRLLADRLVGDPARAAFGTGAVTFCSLSPLRSVPHRVVCILGLDQDALPRGLVSGDDLLAAAPALGDRDPRSEARQLLLEAVLAAGDALVVTAGGADVRTNAPVPPAVVLDELMDCLGDLCAAGPAAVHVQVRTEHPRQAFDEANFVPGAVGGVGGGGGVRSWSFDPLARDGAAARRGRDATAVPGPLLTEPLAGAAPGDGVVALEDLRRFLRKPVETFFTDRLGLRLPRVEDEGVDDLPVQLDPLERYQVGDQLLACLIEGLSQDRVLEVIRARGALPPGRLGEDAAAELRDEVAAYLEQARDLGTGLRAGTPRAVDVGLGGRRLRGVVACGGDGDRPGPLSVRFSRTKPHHRLLLAVDLLALTAAEPHTDWRAVSIHRGRAAKDGPACTVLTVRGDAAPARRATALDALGALLGLRDRGLSLPLPIFDATSRALFDAGGAPGPAAMGPIRAAWSDEGRWPECDDPYHRLAFGSPSAAELLALRVDGSSPSDLALELWSTVESAVAAPEEPEPEEPGP